MNDPRTTISLRLTLAQAERLQALHESGELSKLIRARVHSIEQADGRVREREGNVATMVKSPSLLSYQVILYNRAIHPEVFPLKGRRVIKQKTYQFEAWVASGAHLLRFESGGLCACELVSDHEGRLPEAGIVSNFLCIGERDFEHRFDRDKVIYMNRVQTERLSENLFLSTYDEMMNVARENNALIHRWEDETGRCLSMIDVEQRNREVHAQCYHLIATGGLVLRTQTIFEQF